MFIEKYPLISETSFSNIASTLDIAIFDDAYEKGYIRERYLSNN